MLHECDRDPVRERAYSIDDITIGLDTTPAAAAACGIRGAMSGGKLTIECWQALPYPSHSPDLVRVTCVRQAFALAGDAALARSAATRTSG